MTKDILDIATLTPGEREIQIVHPATKEPLPIWVRLMSADDQRLKRHQRQLVDRQQERQRRGKIFTAEEKERAIIDLMARAIVDWKFEIHYNGEFPQFSTKKAIEMLSDPNIPWFFEQINNEMGDSESFF